MYLIIDIPKLEQHIIALITKYKHHRRYCNQYTDVKWLYVVLHCYHVYDHTDNGFLDSIHLQLDMHDMLYNEEEEYHMYMFCLYVTSHINHYIIPNLFMCLPIHRRKDTLLMSLESIL